MVSLRRHCPDQVLGVAEFLLSASQPQPRGCIFGSLFHRMDQTLFNHGANETGRVEGHIVSGQQGRDGRMAPPRARLRPHSSRQGHRSSASLRDYRREERAPRPRREEPKPVVNPVTTTTRVQLHPPRRPSAEATGWIRTDPSRPSRTLRAARTRVRPPQPFRARRASHHSIVPTLPEAAEADGQTLSQDVGASTLCGPGETPRTIAP